MSPLWTQIKRPRNWIILFGVILVLGAVDSFRPPHDQLTGWVYVRCVGLYQWGGRPLLKGHVQCRFHPTCSEYSIEAVETRGIRSGLVLTYKRLSSCTHAVPLGTEDPVPPTDD
jgi:putative membrane protein insertion efficiency factor